MLVSLSLDYPPSVNVYWRHRAVREKKTKRLKVINYLSAEAKDYRAHVAACVWEQLGSAPHLKTDLAVTVHQYHKPGRRQDIDNCLKALFDALEHAGVYEDDKQIDQLLVIRKRRVAKSRVDVFIKPI